MNDYFYNDFGFTTDDLTKILEKINKQEDIDKIKKSVSRFTR